MISRNENWSYLLFPFLLGLTRREKEEDILTNHNRGMLHGAIKALPGISLGDLKSKVGINNSVATYHLRVLEREGMIRSEADPYDKRARRFYPTGVKLTAPYYRLTQIQLEIVQFLMKHQGSSVMDMTRALQLRDGTKFKQQTLDYNLKRLWQAGCLRRERDKGNVFRWYVVPERVPELYSSENG